MYEPINIRWIHCYNYLRLKKNIYSVVGIHTGYISHHVVLVYTLIPYIIFRY